MYSYLLFNKVFKYREIKFIILENYVAMVHLCVGAVV